jgi:hypothetical protein
MEDGDYICSDCYGNGYIESSFDERSICNKCNGHGGFNWIENVFGYINVDKGIDFSTFNNIKEHNIKIHLRKETNFLLHNYPFEASLKRIQEFLKGLKTIGKIYSYEFQHFKVDYLGSEFIEITVKICYNSIDYHLRFDVKDLRQRR